jgi:excinuclease UvrABC nuclease subunit
MSLPELYKKLLDQYEQVLNVTQTILAELKKGEGEKKLNLLLEKKESLGDEIARLTQQIASSSIGRDSRSDLSTLAEVKDLLRQVTEKANLVQGIEGKIQDFLQRKD